jgi:hypothetical protein
LLYGSINVRERPWASKRQPIDYKPCCTDRLSSHPETGHQIAPTSCRRRADSVEKVESSAALQNCRNDIDIFDQLKLLL